MNDFLSILSHGRRLQGAVKDLSVEELENIAEKLSAIIEKKKQQELELQKQQEEKREKLEAIKKQMEEAGIDISDLQEVTSEKSTKKAVKKRPVKYQITNNGETTSWTGIGRMPLVFKDAIENGKSLEDFTI